MRGIEQRVVYFRKLLFETDNEKFSIRRVKSKKISRHPGGRKSVAERSGGGRYVNVSQSCEDGRRKKVEYHLRKGGGLQKVRDKSAEWVVYMTKSRGPSTEP